MDVTTVSPSARKTMIGTLRDEITGDPSDFQSFISHLQTMHHLREQLRHNGHTHTSLFHISGGGETEDDEEPPMEKNGGGNLPVGPRSPPSREPRRIFFCFERGSPRTIQGFIKFQGGTCDGDINSEINAA